MMRDAKGLSAEQMNEFRASFNHFDRVSIIFYHFYTNLTTVQYGVHCGKMLVNQYPSWLTIIRLKWAWFLHLQDNDGIISTEELQGCLTALGHIVESNDPAKVNLSCQWYPFYWGYPAYSTL